MEHESLSELISLRALGHSLAGSFIVSAQICGYGGEQIIGPGIDSGGKVGQPTEHIPDSFALAEHDNSLQCFFWERGFASSNRSGHLWSNAPEAFKLVYHLLGYHAVLDSLTQVPVHTCAPGVYGTAPAIPHCGLGSSKGLHVIRLGANRGKHRGRVCCGAG